MRDLCGIARIWSQPENLIVKYCVGTKTGTSLGGVKNKKSTWARFSKIFDEDEILVDTSITFAGYSKLDQDAKLVKKSAPGNWMAAHFRGGRRKLDHQIARYFIVFDIDNVTPEQLNHILSDDCEINQYLWLGHTTRAHCPEKPRVRMMFPTSRGMDATETHAITRLLALQLAEDPDEAIEIPDLVSFRFNQVMFKPSISKGQDYWVHENPGEVLDVEKFLADNPGWDNYTFLPYQVDEKQRAIADPNRKIEDPREKNWMIGAWCRTYTVEDVIAEHLGDIYVPGDSSTETRYTYTLGSGSNGAVVYDEGLFLHSNHGTDPAEGQANAFDLLRIHKFGYLDKDAPANTSPGNLPSFKAMAKFAENDPKVKAERLSTLVPDDAWHDEDEETGDKSDRAESGADDLDDDLAELLGDTDADEEHNIADEFDDDFDDEEPESKPEKKKLDWNNQITINKQDNIEKTLHNCMTIICGAPKVANAIALNEMDGGPYVRKLLKFPKIGISQAPVTDRESGRRWTDNDTAALMRALAAPPSLGGMGVSFTKQDVELALLQAAQQNSYNPVKDRIEKVVWDGTPRLATFFHDWLGCADTAYHSELATVWFVAGITRLYEPGHVFDLVPILGGKQGGGKTGLIRELGLGFTGALSGDFHDTQKMAESTKGKFILEVPELKGMIEDIKAYFTATQDTVRLAYRRNEEDFKRQCIYMGTTNENHYLRDEENRRFCPVLTTTHEYNIIDFENLVPIIPQLWAEAREIYLQMRKDQPRGMLPLHFTSQEARDEAHRLQTESRETMAHEPAMEVIETWLNAHLSQQQIGSPGNEDFDDDDPGDAVFLRNLVTTTMIREELASSPIIRDLRGAAADKTIASALKSMPGWYALGAAWRLGSKRRWYSRFPADNPRSNQEFIRSEDIPVEGALGITARVPDVDDLLS